MSDLIERLRAPLPNGMCGQSMGCNAASICLCSVIEDQRETLTEAADEIAALRERAAVLDAEMARFVSDFEMDFVLDGAIVDDPDPMLKTHYVLSRAILAKQEASHEG